MLWQITWSDGNIDIVESDEKPDEDSIESGIDADSSRWGQTITEIRRI
jgi:hypothetical protein